MGTSGGGLSAAELAAETLFPGDTVEYFSMMFVAGDPRGHRVAKVLRVDRSDEDFPIRVETEEMLPLTMMLKRKRNRLGLEVPSSDAKWRKLRTFRLVDGEVEGETRAQRLNAGLKKAVNDSFAAVRKQLAADNARAKSRQIMQSFFKPVAVKEKENGLDSGSDDDDDFVRSPSSEKKERQSIKRASLARTGEPELNKRHTGVEARSPARNSELKKKKKKKKKRRRLDHLRKERETNDSPHRKSSPSPRRPDADRASKRRRLDFTNSSSIERSHGETTPADDNDEDEEAGEGSTSARHKASPHRSERSMTPETATKRKKMKVKIQIQRFVDQIQEKKRSASCDEYVELDKEEQELRKMMKSEGLEEDTSALASASRGTKTLQLNKSAGDARRWQDSRKKFRDSQEVSNTRITSWLTKRPSTNTSSRGSPSPSKHRRDKEAKMETSRGSQERKAPVTALESMLNEVPEAPCPRRATSDGSREEKRSRSGAKTGSVKGRRPGGGLLPSRKSVSDGKRPKAPSASSAVMDTWMQRKRKC